MDTEIYLKDWHLFPGATEQEIKHALALFGHRIPDDYVQFLCRHDGGEGFIGDKYLILWRSGELVNFNQDYEVEINAPGLILFGSDGGGEGYGFDSRDPGMPIVMLPFIGMDWQYAKHVANTFTEFMQRLTKGRIRGE